MLTKDEIKEIVREVIREELSIMLSSDIKSYYDKGIRAELHLNGTVISSYDVVTEYNRDY